MKLDQGRSRQYQDHVNPAWYEVLEQLGLTAQAVKAEGCRLEFDDGSQMLDFVSGYGAMALGHNHPALRDGLIDDLYSFIPNLHPLGVSASAGELAAELIHLAGMDGGKVFFGSTGADAVEAALKFAFTHTGRQKVVSISGGFHGLSIATTSLAGSDFWRQGLPAAPTAFSRVDLGELEHLRVALGQRDIAAVLLEPIQGTAGARAWDPNHLRTLAHDCRASGTTLIYDEVLSGLGRSGDWFAFQALGVEPPDMVVVSKGLTGGIYPVSAVLMSDPIYRSTFARPGTAKIHGSTFGGNRLAMRCGLRTLRLLQEIDIRQHVRQCGRTLQRGIDIAGTEAGFSCEGIGLILSIRAGSVAIGRFGADASSLLWQFLLDEHVMTMPAAHDATSIRLLPPLNIQSGEIEEFLSAFARAVTNLTRHSQL